MTTATLSKTERYLAAARGEQPDRPPVWLMRQAGRYLPEYRELRAQHSFLDFCRSPEVAAAATLMPLDIFDVDVLIVFNDILTPLEEMGLQVEFPEGGPRILNPVRAPDDLDHFTPARFTRPPVVESLCEIRRRTGPDVPVLGFCGAPFTLAVYTVEGAPGRNHARIMQMMYAQPELLEEILARLTDTAAEYLIAQATEGGAHGLQIFESWGSLAAMPADYERFAARWQRRLIERVRAACPGVPIQLYVRGTAGKLASMAESGADVLSIDWSVSLADARRETGAPLQGNLHPMSMTAPDAVERAVRSMVEGFDWRRGWIANLGHGITPEADPAAVHALVAAVRSLAREAGP